MAWGETLFHLCTHYFDLTLQYNLVANLILEYVMVPFKSHKSGKEGFNQYIPEPREMVVNELVLQHKKMGQNTGSFGTIAIPSM